MKHFTLLLLLAVQSSAFANSVSTTEDLVAAVQEGNAGDTILIGEGVFELSAPLEPKAGMTIQGAGKNKTIITHSSDWNPGTRHLPDSEVNTQRINSRAYLFRLSDKADGITISGLTLLGPQMHGAIFGLGNKDLHLHHLRIEDTLYCGIRTFASQRAKIQDCEFVDAGGKWKRDGIPGTDGGISGGAIFVTWMTDSEISNNRIRRTKQGRQYGHYGIKGRGGRRIHIHHNTIDVNFSIEFPFESADSFEIDHNILQGVVSIPKHAGGKVPESGVTYEIHHNYFNTSYAIEFMRNGVDIHHNLFDFDVDKDGGNLISGFGKAAAAGPADFHHNLVSNPGRGVIWIQGPYDHLKVRNNHIIARTTTTPRKEGLFGLNGQSDFQTIQIINNIIECRGSARPLLRSDNSYNATIKNNLLTNVSDIENFENPEGDETPGLGEPLRFSCGVNGEMVVDQWRIEMNGVEMKDGEVNEKTGGSEANRDRNGLR
ncbi:MAG: right-handed parallel beta-helix repeat-containing protein [Planctomycetota bacterium]